MAQTAPMLEALGLTHVEAQCYERLVKRPAATAAELGTAIETADPEVRAAVEELTRRGLVTASADDPPRLQPAPPDVAVEALVAIQREALSRAHLVANELTEVYRSSRGRRRDGRELIEVVEGPQAMTQCFRQLQLSARDDFVVLNRPPYHAPAAEQRAVANEMSARVRSRGIYERRALEEVDSFEDLAALVATGEEMRVLPQVPLKIALADHRLALVPVQRRHEQTISAVLVRPCGLLDALRELVELLWRQAAPVRLSAQGSPRAAASAVRDQDEQLLALLEAGLPDRVIGRRLGLAERTVSRRVQRLMRVLGASTRFQLGSRAQARGWLSADGATPRPEAQLGTDELTPVGAPRPSVR